jgi:TolA-binding protein
LSKAFRKIEEKGILVCKNKLVTAALILVLFQAGYVFSQSGSAGAAAVLAAPAGSTLARLYDGINLYGQGKWDAALRELRAVEAETVSRSQRAEALYWMGLAGLSAGDYAAALGNMEALEIFAPDSMRMVELPYHKGRTLYFLGRYDDAIINLKTYADAIPPNPDGSLTPQNASKKAAALYWVAESLYSMGQLDRAGEIFLTITEEYPQSPKYEAASYRIALINQKKVETELLNLVKWTHEESLKTMEEYERRERSYDQALAASQKRIADIRADGDLSDSADSVLYRQQLAAAEERIRLLEEDLRQALNGAGLTAPYTAAPPPAVPDSAQRLNSLKSSALGLRDEILKNPGNVSITPGPGR